MKRPDWELIDQGWRILMIGVCFAVTFFLVLFPGFAKKRFVQACQKCIPKRVEVIHVTDEAVEDGPNVNAGMDTQLS